MTAVADSTPQSRCKFRDVFRGNHETSSRGAPRRSVDVAIVLSQVLAAGDS